MDPGAEKVILPGEDGSVVRITLDKASRRQIGATRVGYVEDLVWIHENKDTNPILPASLHQIWPEYGKHILSILRTSPDFAEMNVTFESVASQYLGPCPCPCDSCKP